MSRKNFPSVLSEIWMWRLASSPISDAERLCGGDMFLTDQGSRRFLFDGFMTRWFDAFDPEATQADRGGL